MERYKILTNMEKIVMGYESIDMVGIQFPYDDMMKNLIKTWEIKDIIKNNIYEKNLEVGLNLRVPDNKDTSVKFKKYRRMPGETKSYIILEWNPNKCNITKVDESLEIILRYVFNKNRGHDDMDRIKLVRLDYAIDIKVPIENLIIFHSKKTYHLMNYPKGKTFYIGSNRSDNMYRIYDKAAETGEKGPLTRIEWQLRPRIQLHDLIELKAFIDRIRPPNIYEKLEYRENIPKTLKVHLFALEHGYDQKEMTRTYRNKLENLLENRQKNIDLRIEKGPLITYSEYLQELDDHYHIPLDEVINIVDEKTLAKSYNQFIEKWKTDNNTNTFG